MSNKEEIIFMVMGSGEYIGNNLGHEIINLHKDDNGNHYIYLLNYGDYAIEHFGKIKSVIFTEMINSKQLKILGVAQELYAVFEPKQDYKAVRRFKELTDLVKEKDKEQYRKRKAIHDKQIQYIHENNITYGGVRMDDIFKFCNKTDPEELLIYITFKATTVLKPKTDLYLTIEEKDKDKDWCCYLKGPARLKGSKSYQFIDEETEIKKVKEFINSFEWDSFEKFENIENISEKNNFLKIIKKEYDELVFSNLLQYYFLSDLEIFNAFVEKTLGIDNFDYSELAIKREYKNIDLLIETPSHIIVIENKIKSDINGKKKDENGLDKDQLDKYKDIANDLNEENKENNKKINFFLFCPDYSSIAKSDEIKGYKIIKYSAIHEFYKIYKDSGKFDKHFGNFLSAIETHTKEVDNRLLDLMQQRFAKVINSITNNN